VTNRYPCRLFDIIRMWMYNCVEKVVFLRYGVLKVAEVYDQTSQNWTSRLGSALFL
jgi:hypothetical protein